MKKLILGIAALACLSAHAAPKGADCYFAYADKRLDQKIQQTIGGLGIGAFWQSGIARTTEIITESIGLTGENEEFYLEEIRDGAYGGRLERVLKRKKANFLINLKDMLLEAGIITAQGEEKDIQKAAEIVMESLNSGLLCKDGFLTPLEVYDAIYLDRK